MRERVRLVILALTTGVGLTLAFSAQGGGPCDAPPYDPLVPVATQEDARAMDRWARRALRRDFKGRTCPAVQEAVDVLLVRWLQAHPDIHVEFNGTEADILLGDGDAFLRRLKAEVWAERKGRRTWFPKRWGRKPDEGRAQVERKAFVRETMDRWGGEN